MSRLASAQQAVLHRLTAMGIEAQLMPGERCVLARMRLQHPTFPTPAGSIRIEEVEFASVGPDRAKCLEPQALFHLPMLRILDCNDATAIEARIHLAWERLMAQLGETAGWLRSIGIEPDPSERESVVCFPLAGEDETARARMIDPSRVILPGRGPLTGIALGRADDRTLTVDPAIDSGIDLEISISTRLEELQRLDSRLSEQRQLDAIAAEPVPAARTRERRLPGVLLVGPRISREQGCAESLRLRGYRVEAVLSERDVAAAFDRFSPELVLADVTLGRSEGIDLIASLRRVPGVEEVPVILFDGRRRPDRREAAQRMGAAGYLVYPIDVARIAQRLERMVTEPRRRRFTRYAQNVSIAMEGASNLCLATAIGRGGMFLATQDDLQTSTLHRCRLSLPGYGSSLRVEAEVLYRARATGLSHRGVGLRFHSFADRDEPTLIRYLKTFHTEPPLPAI